LYFIASVLKGEQCSLIPALLPSNPPPEFAAEWNPTSQAEAPEKGEDGEIDYAKIVLKKVYRFDFIPRYSCFLKILFF
jgi:hypothetical protein